MWQNALKPKLLTTVTHMLPLITPRFSHATCVVLHKSLTVTGPGSLQFESGSNLKCLWLPRRQQGHVKQSGCLSPVTKLWSVVSTSSLNVRYYHCSHVLNAVQRSRKIPGTKRIKQKMQQLKDKVVHLIDENGSNLGEMDSTMAMQLADGKGLKLTLVQRETKTSIPVYKLVSKKQLWDTEKLRKQQAAKKDPRNVMKSVSFTTSIGTHDLSTKLEHVKEFLSKLHRVHVTVQSKFPMHRLSEEKQEEEKEEQVKMLGEVEKSLEGLGEKQGKERFLRNKLSCTFQSTVAKI